jgi:hypothetical protein
MSSHKCVVTASCKKKYFVIQQNLCARFSGRRPYKVVLTCTEVPLGVLREFSQQRPEEARSALEVIQLPKAYCFSALSMKMLILIQKPHQALLDH